MNQNALDRYVNEIVKTNNALAEMQIRSILDSYFRKEEGGSYAPIMADFKISNTGITSVIKVPLITMVPISMLAIGQGFIDSSLDSNKEENVDKAIERSDIKIEQQPLPQGLAILISALANTITPE